MVTLGLGYRTKKGLMFKSILKPYYLATTSWYVNFEKLSTFQVDLVNVFPNTKIWEGGNHHTLFFKKIFRFSWENDTHSPYVPTPYTQKIFLFKTLALGCQKLIFLMKM